MPRPAEDRARDRDRVLTQAVVRAAGLLGLKGKGLAGVLGVSEASVSRLGRGRRIEAESKEGELAVLLVRIYRSLDALVGGDAEAGTRVAARPQPPPRGHPGRADPLGDPEWSVSASIWTRCGARASVRPLRARAWRVVEGQHRVSTRRLVDSHEDQELLEELLERSKPPLPETSGLHYPA